MTAILKAVCALALDQYGNCVIQHVLQHGKPEECSIIIKKLAGQIMKMSQHKFASNVVKCLTFGTPEERQILIDKILGTTDENEHLQVMMKDQFGNCVVRKVLETCDEQNLELILSHIKVHLNAYTNFFIRKMVLEV